MACTGTYIGECCEEIEVGAATISLVAGFADLRPYSYATFERQWARYTSNFVTVREIDAPGRVEFRQDSVAGTRTCEFFNGYRAFRPVSFYEGTVTETTLSLDFYSRSSEEAPLREFHQYHADGVVAGAVGFSWDRALALLLGLSFEGMAAGAAQLWTRPAGGPMIGPQDNGFGAPSALCATQVSGGPDYNRPPLFGSHTSLDTAEGQANWMGLPASPCQFGSAFDTVICSKSLVIDSGYGRERRYWTGRDALGFPRPRTRYYCAGNLAPGAPITLFPDIAGSGAPGFNTFESIADFFPGIESDPCGLP